MVPRAYQKKLAGYAPRRGEPQEPFASYCTHSVTCTCMSYRDDIQLLLGKCVVVFCTVQHYQQLQVSTE